MNIWDWVILAVVAALLYGAVRRIRKKGKGCGGCCEGCKGCGRAADR